MLLQNIRAKIGARLNGDSEAGFTLIELLVVMLILGILAAIALPAFFNQKGKANDAKAKETAHTAQVAMETCATENNCEYTLCDMSKLEAIEPTLSGNTNVTAPLHEASTYKVKVTSNPTSQYFEIYRESSGKLKYPCSVAATGGCPKVGTEGNWAGG